MYINKLSHNLEFTFHTVNLSANNKIVYKVRNQSTASVS